MVGFRAATTGLNVYLILCLHELESFGVGCVQEGLRVVNLGLGMRTGPGREKWGS